MPNFYCGPALDPAAYPPDTPEKMATIMAFLDGPANIERGVENVQKALSAAKTMYPDVEKWGAVGYCWGGKVRVSGYLAL